MRRQSLVTGTLGLNQIVTWGCSYYLPAVLGDAIAADLGMSRTGFFALFSVALGATAVLGPAVGRRIDAFGGRGVLASANLVLAAGLVAMSLAAGPAGLIGAWALMALGMSLGLYEQAFATLTTLYGRDAQRSIAMVTVIGAFTSTVGWPLSAVMLDGFGWRGACLGWALLNVGIGLPCHLLLVPRAQPGAMAAGLGPQRRGTAADPEPADAGRLMLCLALSFTAVAFIMASMGAHLPRLLQAAGSSREEAILAGALFGPAQAATRLMEVVLMKRRHPLVSARLATVLHPAGAVALFAHLPLAAPVFALLHGAGNGMLTVARGTLPLALFGPAGYGARTGLLATPQRIAQAAAPLLFGLVLDGWGAMAALALTSTLGLLSCAALFGIAKGGPRTTEDAA